MNLYVKSQEMIREQRKKLRVPQVMTDTSEGTPSDDWYMSLCVKLEEMIYELVCQVARDV